MGILRRRLTSSTQDWYHESCINLRERPASRAPSPETSGQPNGTANEPTDAAQDGDDALSEATSSGLPPPLITASSYDAFVCSGCVRRIDTLRRYAGTPGVLMVVRDTPQEPWRVIGQTSSQNDIVDIETKAEASDAAIIGEKRPHPDAADDAQPTKRARQDPAEHGEPNGKDANGAVLFSPCLAPEADPKVQAVLSALDGPQSSDAESLGAGDIFLTQSWRDRWCRCKNVSLSSVRGYASILRRGLV